MTNNYVYGFFFAISTIIAGCTGNHPDAKSCTADKPFFTFCTHHAHKLEGWKGSCFDSHEDADKDAKYHAERHHKGNSHWTGVLKLRE